MTIRVEITVPTIGAKSAVLLTASLVSSLIMLDSNIVAVSLPAIGRSLAASFTDIQWVVSAYVLTYAALLEWIPVCTSRKRRSNVALEDCRRASFLEKDIDCVARIPVDKRSSVWSVVCRQFPSSSGCSSALERSSWG